MYHLYLCICHYYKDEFITRWEKIPLLHAQTSPSYCPLIQISRSLPPTILSSCPSLLLATTLADLFPLIYHFKFIFMFQYIILMKESSAQDYVYWAMSTTTAPTHLCGNLRVYISYLLSKNSLSAISMWLNPMKATPRYNMTGNIIPVACEQTSQAKIPVT
jgi:hypothetical protein